MSITRTYTFSDSNKLINSQLESEIGNIVDTLNSGEYIENFVTDSSPQNFPTSGQYGNLITLNLPLGDWELTASIGAANANSSSVTSWIAGITNSYSGPNNAGYNLYNYGQQGINPSSSPTINTYINLYRRFLSSSAFTIYLRYGGTYTSGPPVAFGIFRARRRPV